MRVALYARVSTALGQDPENQLIELRRWAAAYNHHIIGEYIDRISSKDLRPQKEMILNLLHRGDIKGVAFWSLDRWGRTMGELVLEMETFQAKGWGYISLKEGIDLGTSSGRLQAHILAAFANFERDRIQERTKLGLARVKAQGKILGRPKGWRKGSGSYKKFNPPHPDPGILPMTSMD